MSGRLYLIVGPSGAGKDTVLAGLAATLAPQDGVMIARRVITRPVTAGAAEQHLPVTQDAFARLRAAGAFALDWDGHGLSYGIGAEVALWLAAGLTVAANGSRGALAQARARFGAALVVTHITAPAPVLAARLAARGRETPLAIAARLQQAAKLEAGLNADLTLCNDGPPEAAIAALRRALCAKAVPCA